jgi:transposase
LRGNAPAPTKTIKTALERFVKERKAPTFIINVDEYLTSQICPICNSRTTENEKDSSEDKLHPVLKCTNCNKHFNRDHMAAMNIRNVFLYMASHEDERPPAFARD